MICPFCQCFLIIDKGLSQTTYSCDNTYCIHHGDTPRYTVTYHNYPTYIISKCFILDKYYFQIDYLTCKTIVSVLEYCFLFDSIEIPKILKVNFNNTQPILDKIKNLMILL